MSTEIGFGIVGAGMVARYHARAIAETPGASPNRLTPYSGVWGAFQRPASARITLRADGMAHVVSATSDIGPAPTR